MYISYIAFRTSRYYYTYGYAVVADHRCPQKKELIADARGPRRILNIHPGGYPKSPDEFIYARTPERVCARACIVHVYTAARTPHPSEIARIRRRFIVRFPSTLAARSHCHRKKLSLLALKRKMVEAARDMAIGPFRTRRDFRESCKSGSQRLRGP